MNLRNKGGIWRLCPDVVSSLSCTQRSASGKGLHRRGIQNLISAAAENRRREWGGAGKRQRDGAAKVEDEGSSLDEQRGQEKKDG